MTPAAVSQHIRALEHWAGADLFIRQSRGVTLTDNGARVQAGFTDAFDALGRAVADLRQSAGALPVTIAALPAIAQLWLTPRLSRLRAVLGSRQVSVHALEQPPNMLRDLYDMSVFIGPRDGGVVLAEDTVFPVCAPAVAAQITTASDLARFNLLHDASWARDWRIWAQACGVSLPNIEDGPRYSLYSMALAEAKAGAGIAMGHSFLVRDALDAGSLVRPVPLSVTTGHALILRLGPAIGAPDVVAIKHALLAE